MKVERLLRLLKDDTNFCIIIRRDIDINGKLLTKGHVLHAGTKKDFALSKYEKISFCRVLEISIEQYKDETYIAIYIG